jgi:N-ethylmaleimide reductase
MNSNPLFLPFENKSLNLKNRIVMAPMTRSRAGSKGIPTALIADYYAQRASAGLIISEATNISPEASGFALTPGIYNDEQVSGWKMVTDAVHAKGGTIFCQLWHVGRISHPSMQLNGILPVAPSAVKPDARCFTENGFVACVTPRTLQAEEIPAIVDQYALAAKRAREVGFDGVEILAAGGYLIDQFLKDKANRRIDEYEGSVANRSRFLMEVTEGVISAWSADHVGVRISPVGTVNDIDDSNPEALFTYVAEQLNQYNLAYLHVMENTIPGSPREDIHDLLMAKLRNIYKGVYIANSGYDLELAKKRQGDNLADLIAFGRPFIANPDLVYRFKIGAPLNDPDFSTFYEGGSSVGYTDYPFLSKVVE